MTATIGADWDTIAQAPLVIDTNVLLDIFIYEDPHTQMLRDLFFAKRLDTVYSDRMLAELADVIARPKFKLSQVEQEDVLRQWQSLSRRVEPALIQAAPWKCKDRDDQIFLDLAFSLKPCTLLSKDKQVLRFQKRARRLGVNVQLPKGHKA